MDFQPTTWTTEAGEFGTFFITRYRSAKEYSVTRVYKDAADASGYGVELLGEFGTMAGAETICEIRLVQLEHGLPFKSDAATASAA